MSRNKLCLSKENRVIAGVCGGIGEYFGIDANLVRIGLVFFALAGGSGILAYVIAWILLPECRL
ncbi:MAG: PspC domain-containing protein [Spirochaetia bacterium]